jgi:hypothetical protein
MIVEAPANNALKLTAPLGDRSDGEVPLRPPRARHSAGASAAA